MTSKDFTAIAQTLREKRYRIPDDVFHELVETFASTFTQLNPKFSYTTFISTIFEDKTTSDSYIAVIKFKNRTALHFGPFTSYEEADAFAQQKFTEYIDASCAYVDALVTPILYPGRKV